MILNGIYQLLLQKLIFRPCIIFFKSETEMGSMPEKGSSSSMIFGCGASARVRLVDGVFSDRGFIVGKVFVDGNTNRVQDAGEAGDVLFQQGEQARVAGVIGRQQFEDIHEGHHVPAHPAAPDHRRAAGLRIGPFPRRAGRRFVL